MLYSNNSHYPIGLDISDLSIKAVQLNKTGDKIKIQAIGEKIIPEGLIVNGEIKDIEKTAFAVKELLSKPAYGHFSSRETVVCLPDSRTFIKQITVDKSLNQLSDVIEHEMEKYIPFQLADIYHDWQIILENAQNYDVLIGAAPKVIVDQYTALLDESSLSAIALEIEPISICRSLLREENPFQKVKPEKNNYCIFDAGAVYSSVIFYSKNSILFTIGIPVTSHEITAKIAQSLNLPYEKAEKAKMLCGLDGECGQGVIKNVLTDTVALLKEKIKEVVDFYAMNFPDNGPIGQIVLCGGGANIKKLSAVINESVSIPCVIGDPLAHLSIKEEEKAKITAELNKDEAGKPTTGNTRFNPAYSTAIGLALRGVFIDEF